MVTLFLNIVFYVTFLNVFQLSFKLDKIALDDSKGLDIHCSFVVMDTKHKTIATMSGDRISCPLPERASIPSLPIGQGINSTIKSL